MMQNKKEVHFKCVAWIERESLAAASFDVLLCDWSADSQLQKLAQRDEWSQGQLITWF